MSPSIATVTTLKAPLGQTLAFVRYHLRKGVRHMYLFFDDPTDDAIPHLADEQRVSCVRCDVTHWSAFDVSPKAPVQTKQMTNATRAFKRARERGIEWLAHIDSDELLYTPASLQQLFASVPPRANVALFPVKEAVPQQWTFERPFQDIQLFKYDPTHLLREDNLPRSFLHRLEQKLRRRSWHVRKRIARKLGCHHPTFIGSFLLGHTNGKAATRTSSRVSKIGNHAPVMEAAPRKVYAFDRGAVLHFDCMGYERWKSKWTRRIDGSAHFETDRFRPDRKRIMERFASALQSGSEDKLRELYQRMYFLSLRERTVLQGLGMIERIILAEELLTSSLKEPRDPQRLNQIKGGKCAITSHPR